MRRTALVTGGSRGIGLGIARRLAADGFHVVINGQRAEDQVSGVVEELSSQGSPVDYVQADISSPRDRERLIEEVRSRAGRLDVLVNNAGVSPLVRADILDAGEESFDRLMSINAKGPYFLTQAAARWMIEQKQEDPEQQCCIVTVSSVSASVASVNRGDYCMSKAALAMSSMLWAVRLAEHGINVYEVRPGIIQTDMTAGVKERYDALIADGLLLQPRWGQPEDVGRCVAALARGDFAYSTGSVIMVDGGMGVPRL